MADKDDPQDKLMPLGGLKAMLKHAKAEPMACAFGLTKEKAPLLLLDKIMGPKKVRDTMKKEAGDAVVANTIRFGTVSIKEEDPTTLNFTVNKPEVGGTIIALVRLAKKCSYGGVVINADPKLDEEEQAEQQAPATPAPGPQAAEPSTIPTAPPLPGSDQPPLDWAGRRKELVELVKRMAAQLPEQPTRKDEWGRLAEAAKAALDSMNYPNTETAIAAFRDSLAAAPPPKAPPPPGDNPFAKSAQAWTITRTRVSNDIDRLRDAITAAYEGDGLAPSLGSAFDAKVTKLRAELADNALVEKLREINQEAEPEGRAKRIGEAKQILARHSGFFSGEAIVGDLDENPFVPLKIKATLTATLAALEKAVH